MQRSVAEEELEQQEESPTNTSNLPWTGKELEEHVRVLLKTNKHGETTEAELKTLIHQATVRRDVVIKLIMHMKAHENTSDETPPTMVIRNGSPISIPM